VAPGCEAFPQMLAAYRNVAGILSRWLTVPAPLSARQQERFGRASGLRVAEVLPDGPAAHAGIRAGDLLLAAASRPVTKAQDLQRLMFGEAIGRPLAITVMRNGALVDVIAEPSELVTA